jgi:hypothetical protein
MPGTESWRPGGRTSESRLGQATHCTSSRRLRDEHEIPVEAMSVGDYLLRASRRAGRRAERLGRFPRPRSGGTLGAREPRGGCERDVRSSSVMSLFSRDFGEQLLDRL